MKVEVVSVLINKSRGKALGEKCKVNKALNFKVYVHLY